jgi:hypothetical protein
MSGEKPTVHPKKESSTNSFLSQLELIKKEEISASAMFLDKAENS